MEEKNIEWAAQKGLEQTYLLMDWETNECLLKAKVLNRKKRKMIDFYPIIIYYGICEISLALFEIIKKRIVNDL